MKERIFTDINGEQLIVRHRKSAVFFLRETDLDIPGYVSPFWVNQGDKTPVIEPKEIKRSYLFANETFADFIIYMNEIASDAWKIVNPRVADSLSSDYDEYYDREHDNNGNLSYRGTTIKLEGPMQDKTSDPFIRLYKFNKRKFESFLFDLNKSLREGKIL